MPSPSESPTSSSPDQTFSAEKIARLAKIELDSEQLALAQAKLTTILSFVRKLDDLDLEDVEPFFGASNINHSRTDQVSPSADRDQALRNAPHSDGQFYLVPSVLKPT